MVFLAPQFLWVWMHRDELYQGKCLNCLVEKLSNTFRLELHGINCNGEYVSTLLLVCRLLATRYHSLCKAVFMSLNSMVRLD